jgi:branched-chain amino acid transport system ATP-binding protein
VLPLVVLIGLNLMDEVDRDAFGVLIPNIRDALHLSDQGILTVVALAAAAGLLLTVPISLLADRTNRVRLALLGAVVWSLFSLGTAATFGVVMLVIVRAGTSVGQGVVFPTHNSLLSDYYPIEARPRVFAAHRGGNSLGVVIGVLVGAGLAHVFNWRVPFVVFAVPTLALVVVGLRMKEPVRGGFEREAGGAADGALGVEPPPSFGEAYRMVWKIAALRRIFVALPFLAAAIIGFQSLASIQYDRTFHLDEVQRALITVPVQVFEVAGLLIAARYGTRLATRSPSLVFKMLAVASVVASLAGLLFAFAPSVPVAFIANGLIAGSLAVVGPGVLASLSLALPPRARAIGFSIGALFVLPGLIVLPVIGGIGDALGTRWGMAMLTPVFLVGGLLVAAVGAVIDKDIHDVWTSTATRAELLLARQGGRLPLLMIRGLDVGYGGVRVLYEIDLDVDEGEIVALLGTNGAGKSTLLRAIGGVTEADNGAVVFDGRDITHMPPEEIARLGIAQVPGGEGVFPSLTVDDNLRAAAWGLRHEPDEARRRWEQVYAQFPILADRRGEPAADLSGGQQQMLALGMALVARPRLLLIDELSLGLAPIVVEQLLELVRELRDRGTTVVLVEQSVNVALEVADRALFMEKGELRFSGSAADLLERPDVLRSVFLHGAAEGVGAATRDTSPGHDQGARGPAPSGATRRRGEPLRAGSALPAAGAASTASAASAGSASAPTTRAPGELRAAAADPGRQPHLEVRGLSVSFGGIAAVRDVSLSVAHGEIVGIIGPNGAGKTTLFDLVSGFTPSTAGEVRLDGVDLTAASASRRADLGLGRSFQDSRLFPSLTVAETLAVSLERWIDAGDTLAAALRAPALVDSEAAIAARVDELLELFGLGPYRDSFVGDLSTGTRRLVDLAGVVGHGPSLLLLDEPSSGIAQREAEALAPLLINLRDHLDATLLVVEHDIHLVSTVAGRLVAMDQGLLIADGPPGEVLAHPQVLEAYLGSGGATLRRTGQREPRPNHEPHPNKATTT